MKGLSIISFLCSIASVLICLGIVNGCIIVNDNINSYLVSVLGIITAILIGWNIYTVIDIKKEMEIQNKKIEELTSQFQHQENEFNTQIQQLAASYEAFKNYGHAITDFAQVYAKLEPEKKNYFKTYSKSLSAFKNFLKTEESIDWYAPPCIENMEEALKKARELNENYSEEEDKDIKLYVEEIRTCTLDGFNKYWQKITELENERTFNNPK